jgi:hypothetical protein
VSDLVILHDEDFLTPEEIKEFQDKFYAAQYNFRLGVEADRNGITGVYGDWHVDKPIMISGSNDPEEDDPLRPIARSILEKFAKKHNINILDVMRTRTNMTFRSGDARPVGAHVDNRNRYEHYVFLYYVNDSDGDTVLYNQLYDGKTVLTEEDLTINVRFSPKAGSAIFFDGSIFHTWHYPIEHDFRCTVNMNIAAELQTTK